MDSTISRDGAAGPGAKNRPQWGRRARAVAPAAAAAVLALALAACGAGLSGRYTLNQSHTLDFESNGNCVMTDNGVSWPGTYKSSGANAFTIEVSEAFGTVEVFDAVLQGNELLVTRSSGGNTMTYVKGDAGLSDVDENDADDEDEDTASPEEYDIDAYSLDEEEMLDSRGVFYEHEGDYYGFYETPDDIATPATMFEECPYETRYIGRASSNDIDGLAANEDEEGNIHSNPLVRCITIDLSAGDRIVEVSNSDPYAMLTRVNTDVSYCMEEKDCRYPSEREDEIDGEAIGDNPILSDDQQDRQDMFAKLLNKLGHNVTWDDKTRVFVSPEPDSYTHGTYYGTDFDEEKVYINRPSLSCKPGDFTFAEFKKGKSGYFTLDTSNIKAGQYLFSTRYDNEYDSESSGQGGILVKIVK